MWLAPFEQMGYNIARVWPYVTWPDTGWEPTSNERVAEFLAFMANRGWHVELTLLTDDDPNRLVWAKNLVVFLRNLDPRPDNLVLEIGNEPLTHKNIDCQSLKEVCESSGYLYASGIYEDEFKCFGTFGTSHTPRDNQWSRKAHDLLEYYTGHGPSKPHDPLKYPWVGDEPIRPDEAPTWWGAQQPPAPANAKVVDFRAYGGVCALLGAGATFHCQAGKFCNEPTAEELQCAQAMAEGLQAFPADAPLGPYRTIDEGGATDDDSRGARTYVVGSYMTRVRPITPAPAEAGWSAIDNDGILFKRT